MVWPLRLLALALLVQAQPKFSTQEIKLGSHKLIVEMARTESERSQGLMFRNKLDGKGMLFVFEREQILSFWMKNTYVPLSIAFINAAGKIVDIQDMAATKPEFVGNPPSYLSLRPAQYALEVEQGWFAKNGISVGMLIDVKGWSGPTSRGK